MSENKLFVPCKLYESILKLREKSLLPNEIPGRIRQDLDSGVSLSLPRYSGPALEKYALSLGSKELELLLGYLTTDIEVSLQDIILKIIHIRMSSRLTRVIWAFIQYGHSLPGLRAAGLMASLSPRCEVEILRRLFLKDEDIISEAIRILEDEGSLIQLFMEKHDIIPESPFALVLLQRYFLNTTEEGFLNNEEYFLRLMDFMAEEDLRPVLKNYLTHPWVDKSCKDINLAIFRRFGYPESGNKIWEGIDQQLEDKFRHWCFLIHMEDYFGTEHKKFSLFTNIYKELIDLVFMEDHQIIILDFGQFAIVDCRNMTDLSYLLEKTVLKRELEKISVGGNPRWLTQKSMIDARDVIIEDKKDDIVKLNFQGIGMLYVRELLEELLRPDNGLWPLRYKQAIAKFVRKAE